MVLNSNSIEKIVSLDQTSKTLLMSKERPIVLLPKIAESLANIAPNLSHYGIMLPYTPLHYLLFHSLLGKPEEHGWLTEANSCVLIVTSANLKGEPIIIEDIRAKELADVELVTYNRAIITRADDSIVRVLNDAPLFIRRARGYVPTCIELPHAIPSTLALGGHLKNTFCVTRDKEAFVSQYIGSINNKPTIDFLHESLNHFIK